MKKDGYLYQCTVCPDGRIKNGGWTLKSVIPKTLPSDQLLFEGFSGQTATAATTISGTGKI